MLKISEREQRRIGQDLHDGLGQHLTGIAFMSKVLEQKLSEESIPESADAAKIVQLVNDAIRKTKELPEVSCRWCPKPWFDVRAEATRGRVGGPVSNLLSLRMRRTGVYRRCQRRHAPLPHRAGGLEQRHPPRQIPKHRDRIIRARMERQF